MFTLLNTHPSGVRRGVLHTAHGSVQTPFFMPIATKGAVKTFSSQQLQELENTIDPNGGNVVLSNTYHLYLTPGLETLETVGGLHQFMDWPGMILTDSGGFQVFSLSNLRKMSERGVEFRSHIDGSKHLIGPEESMHIQSVIGSDVWMAFDYFPGYPATRKDAEFSVGLTTRWGKRCVDWVAQYRKQHPDREMQLFGIVQGSTFDDLREQSAQELMALGFDGYAIGGLAVGEPEEEMYRAVETVAPLLPEDKPRYLMGTGYPEQLWEAVQRGVDMFDCVLPTRNARHGKLFVHAEGTDRILQSDGSGVKYETINVRSAEWENATDPIDPHAPEGWETNRYTRAYVRHLFKVGEALGGHIATQQNLRFYLKLMQEIREFAAQTPAQ